MAATTANRDFVEIFRWQCCSATQKELEHAERIAEKIAHLSVVGGIDALIPKLREALAPSGEKPGGCGDTLLLMHRLSEKMTPNEFLAWEREQPSRHHYLRGDIFDMAGGSPRHNALGMEVGTALANALKGSSCRTFSADQKLGVASDLFVYADVSVVCGPLDLRAGTKDVVTNPVVVVEVLSKSTEIYDRTDKLNDYLALPSVKHVLLVSQNKARIDVYTREADHVRYESFVAGASITLAHPKVTLSVDALYAGIFDLPGDE